MDGSKISREVMTLEYYVAFYRHVPQSIPLFRPAVPEGHNNPQQSARMLPSACGSPTTSDYIQSSLLFLFRPLSEIHTPVPLSLPTPLSTHIRNGQHQGSVRQGCRYRQGSPRGRTRQAYSGGQARCQSLRFLTTHHSRNSSLHICISSTPTSSRLTKVMFPVLPLVCSTLSARPSTTPGRRFLA